MTGAAMQGWKLLRVDHADGTLRAFHGTEVFREGQIVTLPGDRAPTAGAAQVPAATSAPPGQEEPTQAPSATMPR